MFTTFRPLPTWTTRPGPRHSKKPERYWSPRQIQLIPRLQKCTAKLRNAADGLESSRLYRLCSFHLSKRASYESPHHPLSLRKQPKLGQDVTSITNKLSSLHKTSKKHTETCYTLSPTARRHSRPYLGILWSSASRRPRSPKRLVSVTEDWELTERLVLVGLDTRLRDRYVSQSKDHPLPSQITPPYLPDRPPVVVFDPEHLSR